MIQRGTLWCRQDTSVIMVKKPGTGAVASIRSTDQEPRGRRQEPRDRRQEAGGRRQEAGGRRQEAGGGRRQEAGGRRQEAGGRRQEAGAESREQRAERKERESWTQKKGVGVEMGVEILQDNKGNRRGVSEQVSTEGVGSTLLAGEIRAANLSKDFVS
eukprot:765762-Hanusia_phi.AAC.2